MFVNLSNADYNYGASPLLNRKEQASICSLINYPPTYLMAVKITLFCLKTACSDTTGVPDTRKGMIVSLLAKLLVWC